MGDGPSRRVLLHGLAASAVTAGTVSLAAPPASAASGAKVPATDWAAFDREIGAAFDTLGNVGGAVAVVSTDAVLPTATFGVRTLQGRQPVTLDTHFAVASTTKSMTATMVAEFVDQGVLSWDQPVIDAWSGFRAPTDVLTRSLRVRDLLGMASGIRDRPATNLEQMTADQLWQSFVTMPVTGPVFYTNRVFALSGYVPLLATGVALRDLESAYAQTLRQRIFERAGMRGAVLAGDLRGVVDDFATGYSIDTRGRVVALPYAPRGSVAPAESGMASVSDMAAWVRLQLRQGRSVTGRQVVSSANLAECWRPHIAVPTGGSPNVRSVGYAMGWNVTEYQGGTTVTLHTGALDGFSTFMGFLPQYDLGLVVLTNMEPVPTGGAWMNVVLEALLSRRLGLSVGGGQRAMDGAAQAVAELVDVGREAVSLDRKQVQPYLGDYEGNWPLVLEGNTLWLRIGSRVGTLLPMPDGTYYVTASTLQGLRVKLGVEADGTRHLDFVGYETVAGRRDDGSSGLTIPVGSAEVAEPTGARASAVSG